MGSMQIDLIKSKLELAQSLIIESAALCETESRGGDGWFSMEAGSLKVVSSMVQMEHDNIDRHERMMLAINNPEEAKAILEEAKRSSGRFDVDDRIKDALKDIGVEISINKVDEPKIQ